MTLAAPIDDSAPWSGTALLRRTGRNLVTWVWSAVSTQRLDASRRKPVWTSPLRLLVSGILAITAIWAAMVLVDGRAILEQRTLAPWIVEFFSDVTDFGRSGWVLVPFGALVLVCAGLATPALGRTNRLVFAALAARFGFIFLAVGLPGLMVSIIKRLIGRARPSLWESGGPFDYAPFTWDSTFASLPSGHGTTAFATAFAIGALYPRLRVPLWAFALTIAVSRVAVSAHYPSDVLAAALIGLFGALIVRNWFAARRLVFAIAPDGSVHTMPGPSWRRILRALRSVVGR